MQKNYSVIKWVVALAIIASGWGITSRLKTPLSLAGMPAGEGLGVSAGSVADTTALRMPKLRIRAGNRHLIEDENGTSFFIAGVCPQNLIHTSTPEQMDVYFANRKTLHFNFAWVAINAFSSSDTSGKPATNPVDASGNSMLLTGRAGTRRI